MTGGLKRGDTKVTNKIKKLPRFTRQDNTVVDEAVFFFSPKGGRTYSEGQHRKET